jgi:hypothetical protein
MVPNHLIHHPLLIILMTIPLAGCEPRDDRLSQFAEQATAQQARQNEQMAEQSQAVARQSQEITSAARQLVEQDAAARRELIQAQDRFQQQTHEERSALNRQHEHVHLERKAAAAAAIREPVIARAITTLGLILAALLPLVVTVYALRRLPDQGQSPVDELLANALLENLEVRAGGPPGHDPPRLADQTIPRLTDSEQQSPD